MATRNHPLASGFHIRVGAIVVRETGGGNLEISKSHTPSDSLVIERADIDDMMVAIDAALGSRRTEGGG